MGSFVSSKARFFVAANIVLSEAVNLATARNPDGLIVVSRHGVRRQFPSSNHDFSKYAPGKEFQTEDEDWGVNNDMGVLTQHGYDAAHVMGKYQGRKYANSLLSLGDCSEMFVYCEEDMPRDEFTAKAFFEGFSEGWKESNGSGNIGECPSPELYSTGVEYLIDQGSEPRGSDGQCRLGSEQEVNGVVGEVDEWTRLLKSKLVKLNDVLGCCERSLCPADHPEDEPCTLLDIPHKWDEEHWYVTYTGPVYAGKYFSEWFLLNYLNGMDYAWGELTEEDVMDLAAFVTEYRHFEFDLLAARPFGSALLTHIVASLDQMEKQTDVDAVKHDPNVKLVYYAAHDTNLLYIAELLDLKWVSKGWQPNHTPPGGELVFETYNIDGELHVAAFFDIATPSQIRYLEDLTMENPPGRVAITIPGCSEGTELLCPLSKLRAIAIRAVDVECITPLELSKYVSDLWAVDPMVASSSPEDEEIMGDAEGDLGDDIHDASSASMVPILLALVMGIAVGALGISGFHRLRAGSVLNGGGNSRGGRGGIVSKMSTSAEGLRNRSAAAAREDEDALLRSSRA